ncbi:Non-specific serine/threonine protein kinase [Handroanthus impetiginosus]|uniref:Non-specific serine/threonine protein kinase n=1 Tax=Handroanthus impetiginosus TaxID=429701 RepID=A0A2G9HWV9_9LAMI|nr:Non-specific serine/threonine protein kinase [Handroanthus impetiginosus]
MNMMRRLKSIASGRSSVSDPGEDSGIKRVKVEQEIDQRGACEMDIGEKSLRAPEPYMETSDSMGAVASTSDVHQIARRRNAMYPSTENCQ